MRGTSVLRYANWPKIHQPLPRTPRQSQQLLDALTSSFRRQLDKEHPSSSQASEPDHNGASPAENPNSSMQATDKHLRNILDNPLFRVAPSDVASGQRREYNIQTEPMLLFDHLAASGSVSKKSLRRCLQSQLFLASRHTEGFVEGLKESRAGSRVVNWWFASGSRERKMLFKSKESTHALVKFMVAEGLQNTAMVMLDLVGKQNIGDKGGDIPKHIASVVYRHLLDELVYAEFHYGRGMPAAVQYLAQASKDLLKIVKAPHTSPEFSAALWGPANMLNRKLRRNPQQVSVAIYEEFLNVYLTWFANSRRTASLHLYHPTQPNPIPFLEFVKKRTSLAQIKEWPEEKQSGFMRTGFDALRIMLDQDRTQEASDLAEFMQQALPTLKDQEAVQKGSGGFQEQNFLARVNLAIT